MTSLFSAYHECRWFGITCESRSSEEVVVAIDLSNLGLVGTIPEEIGIGLEAIEDLTLYNRVRLCLRRIQIQPDEIYDAQGHQGKDQGILGATRI